VRIEQLAQEFDLQLQWTVFPLHPETPDEGRELSDLFAGQVDVPSVMSGLKDLAGTLDLPFATRTHTYNSRRAQELGKWAEIQGQGNAFREAVFRAYFAAGRNIASLDELTTICRALDLSVPDALQVLADGDFSAAVDCDWERSRTMGVTSVPTHIYENRILVGFQDDSAFQQLVKDSPIV
jgi:predicted DsbA family dithiol-disulfide isomerase